MREHEIEPVPGLPERLPKGERMLWQGSPRWQTLALTAFHVRALAVYFALLAVWRGLTSAYDGNAFGIVLADIVSVVPIAAIAIGVLCILAWAIGRSTLYTITSERLVMRYGMALPKCINIPFKTIEGAGLHLRADGSGDIPVSLTKANKVAYLVLWPHARPWRLGHAEPMLRSIPDARRAADHLATALAAHAGAQGAALDIAPAAETALDPHGEHRAPRGLVAAAR